MTPDTTPPTSRTVAATALALAAGLCIGYQYADSRSNTAVMVLSDRSTIEPAEPIGWE